MAKAKGAARPRSVTPRSPRRTGGFLDSFPGSLLKPLAPISSFFLTPSGLGVAIVLIVAAALPWLSIVDVIDAFRRAYVRASGTVCYVLVLDGLALVLLPTLRSHWRRSISFWRAAAGSQFLGVFAWGLLGRMHPDVNIAGVALREVSAGGEIGHGLTDSPTGLIVWLALLLAGFTLVTPAGARWTAAQIPVVIQRLWRLNLPGRAWRSVSKLHLPARPQPAAAAGGVASGATAPEEEPRPATIGQGAADAFRRSMGLVPPRPPAPATAPAAVIVAPPQAAPVAKEQAHAAGVGWQLPGAAVLGGAATTQLSPVDNELRSRAIVTTLASFGVDVKIVQINQGPTVTQFGIEPGWEVKTKTEAERDAAGKVLLDKDGRPKLRIEEVSRTRVRVKQIINLQNDLALGLAAPSIRIEAPVPGKSMVGIEVPNTTSAIVSLRSVVESPQFAKANTKSRLALALGMGVSGEPIVADLARMPHLLIAGSTGSGKSVCINAIIACILMHATPEEVRFVLIDPKRVEMAAFQVIPHLALSKIITDMEDVPGTLQGVIREMEARYKKFEQLKVRNLEAYNRHPKIAGKLPQWVVVIDELADLMMAVPYEVERQICRLAQLARATGIHLVVATQRPSVDVITGLIKANFPTRIAFAVSSQVDSRTILDRAGAEKLLGRGDMLFTASDAENPRRLQGVYVSDEEIERLVDFWGAERWEKLRPQTFDHLVDEAKAEQAAAEAPEEDELIEKARALALEHDRISTSMLQRRLRIGYPRAARLMDALEDEGIVGSSDGGTSREVLGSEDDSIFGDL